MCIRDRERCEAFKEALEWPALVYLLGTGINHFWFNPWWWSRIDNDGDECVFIVIHDCKWRVFKEYAKYQSWLCYGAYITKSYDDVIDCSFLINALHIFYNLFKISNSVLELWCPRRHKIKHFVCKHIYQVCISGVTTIILWGDQGWVAFIQTKNKLRLINIYYYL